MVEFLGDGSLLACIHSVCRAGDDAFGSLVIGAYIVAERSSSTPGAAVIRKVNNPNLKIRAAPPETKGLRTPWQLYPKESMDKHEEGTVTMKLKLDPDWCVRKATIVQSSGYWRLDGVSLSYLMTVKFNPKPELIKQKDGGPTITIRLGWGESQGKH
jgi:TonB family protein